MSFHRSRLLAASAACALLLVGAACSSDDDAADAAGEAPTEEATSEEAPAAGASDDATSDSAVVDVGPEGDITIPSDLPLESVVTGLEVAMDPTDIEIDGDTIHVYLAEDNAKVPAGTECIIVTSVLPEGASAVIHRGGEETAC